jgi:hypothetical protein
VRRLQGKHLLRAGARGLVPDFVLAKRKRGFFNEAVGSWLGAGDGSMVEDLLLAPDPAYGSVVDPAVVATAVREFRAGQGRHAPLLLSLIMLETWLTDTLPRAFSVAPDAVAA